MAAHFDHQIIVLVEKLKHLVEHAVRVFGDDRFVYLEEEAVDADGLPFAQVGAFEF